MSTSDSFIYSLFYKIAYFYVLLLNIIEANPVFIVLCFSQLNIQPRS